MRWWRAPPMLVQPSSARFVTSSSAIRAATLSDPYGHRVARRLEKEDVTPEEMQRRMDRAIHQ